MKVGAHNKSLSIEVELNTVELVDKTSSFANLFLATFMN